MSIVSILFRVVAVLCACGAGAAAYITMGKVDEITSDRDRIQGEYDTEVQNHKKTTKDLNNTKSSLKTTQSKLDDIKGKLKTQIAANNTQKNTIISTKKELQNAKTKIGQHESKIEELKRNITELENAVPDVDPAEHEEALARIEDLEDKVSAKEDEISTLKSEIDDLEKGQVTVAETDDEGNPYAFGMANPVGQPASILALEPSLGLMVLNVGSNLQLKPNQVVGIMKSGRRVAEVKLAQVSGSESVANILPGYGAPEVLRPSDQISIVQ